jgi:CubicO group peptidase (beta-lactamase class C family)
VSENGFTSQGLAKLADVLSGYVERQEVSGLVALVSRSGDTHVETMGTMSLNGPPVRRDSIYRIASMTKPVTAVATMTLIEEGAFGLDDPVDRLLPELADRRVLVRSDGPVHDTVPAERPLTIRHLLTFTMGMGIGMAEPGTVPLFDAMAELNLGQGPPNPQRTLAPNEWMAHLGSLPLMYQPGERWMYNTGSDVLGVLITRAAGQDLSTFLHQRIFEPLGMVDTGFFVTESAWPRLVTAYAPDPTTGQLHVYDEGPGGQWTQPPPFPSGAGGLVSTVDDFARFAEMLLGHGTYRGTQIISSASVAAMTSDQLTTDQKSRSGLYDGQFDHKGWGFGVEVVTDRFDPANGIGKYAWNGGLGSSWSNDQAEGLITILLTQVAWTSPVPPPIVGEFDGLAYEAMDR